MFNISGYVTFSELNSASLPKKERKNFVFLILDTTTTITTNTCCDNWIHLREGFNKSCVAEEDFFLANEERKKWQLINCFVKLADIKIAELVQETCEYGSCGVYLALINTDICQCFKEPNKTFFYASKVQRKNRT